MKNHRKSNTAAIAAKECYEGSVAMRALNRAVLTKSPTATVKDVVMTNKGRVVGHAPPGAGTLPLVIGAGVAIAAGSLISDILD